VYDGIFGRLFLKRFALRYQTVVCPVLSVCDVGVLWPNNWVYDQDDTWHAGRQRHGHIVLDGDSAPPPQKGEEPPPQLLTHVHCGQTAGWIKTTLGTEVGLGPGHIC